MTLRQFTGSSLHDLEFISIKYKFRVKSKSPVWWRDSLAVPVNIQSSIKTRQSANKTRKKIIQCKQNSVFLNKFYNITPSQHETLRQISHCIVHCIVSTQKFLTKEIFQNNIPKLSSLNKLQFLHNFNVYKFSFLLPQDNFYILNSVMLCNIQTAKNFYK